MISCTNEEEFQLLLAESHHQPVILFKHSTRCPISAGAQARMEQYLNETIGRSCHRLLVVEYRPLSLAVAEACGVAHQSPQVIIFHNGKAVWHCSHSAITAQRIEQEFCQLADNTVS